MTFEEFEAFRESFFSSLDADVLIEGNVPESSAKDIFNSVVAFLSPCSSGGVQYEKEVRPVTKNEVYVEASPDPGQRNCAVEIYWQFGAATPELRALMEVLDAL